MMTAFPVGESKKGLMSTNCIDTMKAINNGTDNSAERTAAPYR
jgi:hypothetical protein